MHILYCQFTSTEYIDRMWIESSCHREEAEGRRGDPVKSTARTGLPRPFGPRNDVGQRPVNKMISWLFIILAALALRIPSFYIPILNVDEAMQALFSQTWLAGGIPYQQVVETKPLFLYAWQAVIFKLFGAYNMIAVHAATAVWVIATAWVLYRIARTLHSEKAGLTAAFFYVVFTTTYIPKFIATSFELIFALPLALNVYGLILYSRTLKGRYLFLSGFMLAIACLTKYQAGINLIFSLGFLFWMALSHPRTLVRSCYFIFGLLCPVALMVGYLTRVGALHDFYFWNFLGSAHYIQAGASSLDFFGRLLVRGGTFILSTLLLWPLGLFQWKKQPWIFAWFFLSWIPVCTGGRFYDHYFLQLLPPLCILAGLSAATLWPRFKKGMVAGVAVPALLFSLPRFFLPQLYPYLNDDNPDALRPAAAYVANHTEPKDSIFVWGFAPSLYFFAERPMGTRFYWSDVLVGRIPGTSWKPGQPVDTRAWETPGAWAMFYTDMEVNRPAYFIDTSPGNYHDYGAYPVEKYPELTAYLEKYYTFETELTGFRFYRRIR